MSIDHRQLKAMAAQALVQGCHWEEGYKSADDGRRSFMMVGPDGTELWRLRMTDSEYAATAILFAPTPAPPTPPPPSPTPPPPPSSMAVGLDSENYGSGTANDVKGAVGWARIDRDLGSAFVKQHLDAGLIVCLDLSGPFNSSQGVSGINATGWAQDALNFYKASGCTPDNTTMIEVLNEPGGTWFWEVDSGDPPAYRTLVQTVWNVFHATYGDKAPKILATYDGSGGETWGDHWWTPGCTAFCDGLVVHPYGGTGDRAASALGNRARVASVHSKTNMPIYVTEVGWPTAQGQSPTGDSLQWSEADQATNITNFVAWARSTAYVAAVMFFNYHDYGTNDWYGVCRRDGSHKPSYAALAKVSRV